MFNNNLQWHIAGHELSALGIYLGRGYSVGGAELDRDIVAANSGAYVTSAAKVGLKKLTLPVFIKKKTNEEAERMRTWLLSMCYGSETELILNNGQKYIAALTKAGAATKPNKGIIKFKLEFMGYQRGEMQSIDLYSDLSVNCISTVPQTPFYIDVSDDLYEGKLCIFINSDTSKTPDVEIEIVENVYSIVVDGIEGEILQDGEPINALRLKMTSFPKLKPGENKVECVLQPAEASYFVALHALVQYYPIYA